MINIVILGGGTGLSNLLTDLKIPQQKVKITVGVAITDNGGSTGTIRDYYNIPAPGDLRKVLNSFIVDSKIKNLAEYRFDENIENHTVGNLILTALTQICGDISSAIEEYKRIFKINYNIYPISNDSSHLVGESINGKIIHGEEQITLDDQPIKKIYYKEHATPHESLLKNLEEADYIILSSGSLYTSTLPTIILPEIKKILANPKIKKIYISNIMTQFGETDNYNLTQHINTIEQHTQKDIIDYVIANNYYEINNELKHKYLKEKAELVKIDDLNYNNTKIITGKFIKDNEYIRHDIYEIQKILTKIIKQEEHEKNNTK